MVGTESIVITDLRNPTVSNHKSAKEKSLAVCGKNVCYTYGSPTKSISAVKNVSINIPEGIIYGLLGPSGCGKTTLLRCLLGRLSPQSGSVWIFGSRPGSSESLIPGPGVGYMPQELALFMAFTARETINYFGQLYGLSKQEREARVHFLLKFLDLKAPDRRVQDLSGGQRRRVSLAAALVHRPPLLILDEPTVGVDPLLRESIWSHLNELAKKDGMTVIITTHYIEEARQADMVGLMRESNLLVEEKPEILMKVHRKDTLEDVFLKICHDHLISNRTKEDDVVLPICSPKKSNSTNDIQKSNHMNHISLPSNKKQKFNDSIQKIWALTEKMAIRLRRNIPILLFQLVLPTIQIILFCICIGQEPKNLPLSVYSQDYAGTNYSQKFLETLNPDYIKLNYFDSEKDAIDAVIDGQTHGALIFSRNYSAQLENRFDLFELMSENKDKILRESTVQFYADGTEFPIQIAIFTQLIQAGQKYIMQLVNQSFPYMAAAIAEPLLKPVDPPIYGELEPSYRDFMAPGLILGVSHILAVGLTALCFVMDRKEGLLERTFVAGVHAYQILFAHIIIQFTIILIQTILLLLTIFVLFQITLKGSIIAVTILTLLQGIAGMSFGFLISSLCYEEQSAVLLSVAIFYPNLIMSGTIWPLEAMPDIMRDLSYLMPQTLAIKSLRYIITRGWSFLRFEVYIGFITTSVWIIIFNVLSVVIFAIKK
ncbi:ABC transporter G family member 20-like [Brevipalpus obovatus]|uniref:ABC transporter G family member 20-like n=1 Tax=Brevipalpus obovatus TaxID=246614 RepID=UPI003D9E151D